MKPRIFWLRLLDGHTQALIFLAFSQFFSFLVHKYPEMSSDIKNELFVFMQDLDSALKKSSE